MAAVRDLEVLCVGFNA